MTTNINYNDLIVSFCKEHDIQNIKGEIVDLVSKCMTICCKAILTTNNISVTSTNTITSTTVAKKRGPKPKEEKNEVVKNDCKNDNDKNDKKKQTCNGMTKAKARCKVFRGLKVGSDNLLYCTNHISMSHENATTDEKPLSSSMEKLMRLKKSMMKKEDIDDSNVVITGNSEKGDSPKVNSLKFDQSDDEHTETIIDITKNDTKNDTKRKRKAPSWMKE